MRFNSVRLFLSQRGAHIYACVTCREFDGWSERCPFEDCSSHHAVRRRARTERTSLSVLPSAQINIGFLAQQNRGANREVFGEKPPPKVGLDMVIGQVCVLFNKTLYSHVLPY